MSGACPPVVRVVGRKNHGKTTLVVALIEHLAARGRSVGAIKHTPHEHPLDVPGKDSARFGAAGARRWALVTGAGAALFAPDLRGRDALSRLLPHFDGCELVLVEGLLDGPGPRIEVFRAEAGGAPLAAERDDIDLLVTDDEVDVRAPVVARSDLRTVATRVLSLAGLR
ncbi:MAG: hypothetical protein Kow0062_03700 [Acidobacteriota bacterium]